MLKNKSLFYDSAIIGSALFSMFFGAGNIIFPSYLGFLSGKNWFYSFLAFFVIDIVLAIIALFAIIYAKSSENLFTLGGKVFSKVILLTVAICLGPLITVPRTASTTYELSILPNFDFGNVFLCNIIFFVIVLLLSIKQSSVIDIIGKILTPLLFLGLIFLIIKGVFISTSEIQNSLNLKDTIYLGVDAGYQSMDVFASVLFGGIIIKSIKSRGHDTIKQKKRVTFISGIIAACALLIIYLGLTYLGAKFSSNFETNLSRTEVVFTLIQIIFENKAGNIFFGVLVALACLSTAIAVVSSVAEYLSDTTKGKIKYTHFVIAICIVSCVMASLTVDSIVALASPILQIIYPPVLTTVFLRTIPNKLQSRQTKFLIFFALFFAALHTLVPQKMNLLSPIFPFIEIGLGWIIPITVSGIFFSIFNKYKKRELH